MLLRIVHGRWPVAAPPANALEAFHRDIVQDYDAWLREHTGGPEPRKSSGTQLTFSKSMHVAYWSQSSRWGSLSPQRNLAGGVIIGTLRCLRNWRFLPPDLRGFAQPLTLGEIPWG